MADNPPPAAGGQPAIAPAAQLTVTYHITEGPQLHVGAMQIEGNQHIPTGTLLALLNTTPGQMLSPRNLAGDHDALVTAYYSRGFDQAAVNVTEQAEPSDPGKVDVVFHIDEGEQIFVRNVLLTGLHFTRPETVARAITVHPGDPLNQTALSDTQRNLYAFSLFNEVDTAVENPTGGEPEKTVLLQAMEARRWALTYGFGFEAQTGQPQNNCAGASAAGVACSPNGKTGVSPRVLADITRNDLFGREQSASLRGTYGLLEQSIGLLYQVPHFEGNPNFGLTFSGGYANSEDVSTYVASRLEGAFRWTENFNRPGSWLSRANTFIYELDFRRVKVAASSLQVYPGEISELSTAARVGGPAFTWIRDTRDLPMDAHRGTYTSFQEFLSDRLFGAQAEFNRIDTSNSSYYSFRQRPVRGGPQYALRPGARLRQRIERADSASRAALRRRPRFAARFFTECRRPARSRDRLPDRRRGSADQQHRIAPAAAHAALVRQYRELCDLSRYGQCVYQCRGCMGQRSARSPARQRRVQDAVTNPSQYPTRLHATRPPVPPPQPACRACAASTTSLMPWARACVTTRRSGPSVSISAIT